MDYNQAVDHLSQRFKAKDWFYDIGQDQYGRIVVYVHYMNYETLHDIPDQLGKYQVLVHFAASILASKEQFFAKPALTDIKTGTLPPPPEEQIVDVVGSVVGADTEEKSLRYLQDELDRLEKMCGSYTLNDIFYEIQDGKNAVTNMSARYPEVRTRLEKLYKMYGFDVIYEELDG